MIPLFRVAMSPNVCQPVNDVLLSGYIGQGPKVEEFEKLLREHFNVPFVNTTNSGTSALQLAVRCVKTHHPDDEIITTPLTCLATTAAIVANGIKLRWADVNPNTCNIDLVDVERKLSRNTVGVMVVHWGGYPVDLDRLKEIQTKFKKRYGFRFAIIEDCAHAWGSRYKGKLIGAHGNLACFSFQAIKQFSTIDGGCLISPTEAMHKRTKLLRWYGIDRDQPNRDFRCELDVPEIGTKAHMNDVNATVGLNNYKYSLEVVARHKENANFYNDYLPHIACKDTNVMEHMSQLDGYDSSYWIYTIRVKRRDAFMKKMNKAGIMVSRVHERNDKHSCLYQFQSFLPGLDELSREMVCVPVGFWVTDDDRKYIVKTIKEGW